MTSCDFPRKRSFLDKLKSASKFAKHKTHPEEPIKSPDRKLAESTSKDKYFSAITQGGIWLS